MAATNLSTTDAVRLCEDVQPYLNIALKAFQGNRFDAERVAACLKLARNLLESELGLDTPRPERFATGISGEGARNLIAEAVTSLAAYRSGLFAPRDRAEGQGNPHRVLLGTLVTIRQLLDSPTFRKQSEGGDLP